MSEKISDDDKKIWLEATKDVQKINVPDRVPQKQKKKGVRKKIGITNDVTYQNFHHRLELDTTSDIDKNTMRRFKKEEFGVEATLDLHGITTDKAYQIVKNFVISSYLQKKRAVLIVTGKGLVHQTQDIYDAKGVLKQLVPEWLKSDELSHMILTYIHPSPKLGGSGALYLLLRRKR